MEKFSEHPLSRSKIWTHAKPGRIASKDTEKLTTKQSNVRGFQNRPLRSWKSLYTRPKNEVGNGVLDQYNAIMDFRILDNVANGTVFY